MAAAAMGDTGADQLAGLNARKRAIQQDRRRLAQDIKNAERKRTRCVEKARGLSDTDLVAILATRAAAKAKAVAKAKAKTKAKAKAAAKVAAAPTG